MPNAVHFGASVHVDLATLKDVDPAKVEAIMLGLAKVVAASAGSQGTDAP